jgi:predicted NBD/HSP70 family sugar kinase
VLKQKEFATDRDYDRTLDELIESIEEILKHNIETIEGVGISLPGLIDPATGTAIYVPYFKWRDAPIAQQVSAAIGLPVTIDNDANAVALAELWFGRPEVSDARDFILVLAAEGVGTGLVFDGQIYRGERGAAGEFGHMIIGTHAPVPCSCGNRDCWEAFSSERATVARYQQLSGKGSSDVSFTEIVDKALAGETNAEKSLRDMALCLGIGISNLVVGFSPEAVVVGGEITRAWSLIEDALRTTIEHSVRRGLPSARILPSTLGKNPTTMGALSLILAGKFAASAFAA